MMNNVNRVTYLEREQEESQCGIKEAIEQYPPFTGVKVVKGSGNYGHQGDRQANPHDLIVG